MKFTAEIPYRRYRYRDRKVCIVVSLQYKRIMKLIGKSLKDGKQVIFTHEIIDHGKIVYDGTWYDKVTVTIND